MLKKIIITICTFEDMLKIYKRNVLKTLGGVNINTPLVKEKYKEH